MKILSARLLSGKEFEKYKDKIQKCDRPWWLSDSKPYQADMIQFVGLSNKIQSTYPHMPNVYLRPVLDIESNLSENDKKIKIFGEWWIVLNKNTIIAETPLFESVFNESRDYSSSNLPDYKSSKIKLILDDWLLYKQVPTF